MTASWSDVGCGYRTQKDIMLRAYDSLIGRSKQLYELKLVKSNNCTIITCLHLRVDDTRVLALGRDVMHLGHEVLFPEQGEEDVVHVDGQDVHEAAGTCGVDGVAGVVGVRPGVGPRGQAPVGRQVEHLLVRVFLAGGQGKTLEM